MLPWKIKICGIKSPLDARAAAEFGAGAIGLNFYSKSVRSLILDEAKAVVAVLPEDVAKIGVFVNQTADVINGIAAELELDAVQLHGNEAPEIAVEIHKPIIRAIRVFDGQFEKAKAEFDKWDNASVDAVLIDSGSTVEYGGTGETLDWEAMLAFFQNNPIVLAGGLNCDNVAQAIEIAGPQAVDVASGVETFPGVKDHEKLRRFIEAANRAFS